jgi:glycosyltransferase involved in cell wall biosynthesis
MKVAVLATDGRENSRQYDLPEPNFGQMVASLFQGFQEIPEIEVHVLSCVQRSVQAPERIGENVFYHALPVPKSGWLRTGYQGCIRAIRRKLRELKPDLVHGQGTERDCAICAVFSGYPNVVTIHGNMRRIARLCHAKPVTYLRITALIEPWILRRTDGVVCNNRYSESEVGKLNRRTWIIPNSVDPRFFEIEPTPSRPPIVLCVGVISERKNQIAFTKAIAPLQAELDFKVRFLGTASEGDPYSDSFIQTVHSYPWAEHLGFVDRDDLRYELSKASLLVLPTLEDNCPMVVLEALAAGVPVVASAVGGIPEIIKEGVNGLMFDPLKAEEIREALGRALTDSPGTAARTKAAKLDALNRFHPRQIAKQTVAAYREVLSS